MANFNLSKDAIASIAVKIEREILQEAGGVQDQYHSAIGGFRMYNFSSTGHEYSEPLLSTTQANYISDRQWLFPVNGFRVSSDLHKKVATAQSDPKNLEDARLKLSKTAKNLYNDLLRTDMKLEDPFDLLVEAVNASWTIKSSIKEISNYEISETIEIFKKAGALATKLCGAGQGGFLLILAEKDFISKLPNHINTDSILNARITNDGCEIFNL